MAAQLPHPPSNAAEAAVIFDPVMPQHPSSSTLPSAFRRLLPAVLLAPFALGLAACETDLDPNDAYRETTVIYAILDPGQTRQIVRINKAFLNTGSDARVIAATKPDSINFPEGVIDARLQALNRDSTVANEYILERVVSTTKPPGTFSNERQVVYQTPDAFPGIDTARIYRVVARNTRTGTVAQGATRIPVPFDRTNPNRSGVLYITRAGTRSLTPFTQADTNITFNPLAKTFLNFNAQSRAGIYMAEMDFHYNETINGVTTAKTKTWLLRENLIFRTAEESGVEINVDQPERSFFDQFLRANIDVSQDPADTERTLREPAFTFRVIAGSKQWADYQEITGSSSALTQTTPEFTNVSGGKGLVTGRVQHSVSQKLPIVYNTPAEQATKTAIKAAFKEYKFNVLL